MKMVSLMGDGEYKAEMYAGGVSPLTSIRESVGHKPTHSTDWIDFAVESRGDQLGKEG